MRGRVNVASAWQSLTHYHPPPALQLVPFVIWQTWKDMEPRAPRFEGMNSMVQVRKAQSDAIAVRHNFGRASPGRPATYWTVCW